MKKFVLTLVLGLSSQSYAATNAASLNDAFANALKAAEADHKNQQVVLKVAPEQVEQATFKRDGTTRIYKVEDNMMTDSTKSALDEQPAKKLNPSDDLAQLENELNDL